MNKLTSIISGCGVCLLMLSCASHTTFLNPVIKSDVPDPSVIRAGDKYYLAGTSGNATPVYPIYRSSDLVNWSQIGAIFDMPPAWTKGEFWAPELYSHNGKYYCYYTAKAKSDGISCIGVAVADSPEGPFTDHGPLVRWTNEAIDAFVFDDNGQLYVTWKAYGLDPGRPIELLGCRLSPDGLHLEGEPFTMLVDTEEIGMEGQCLFKKGKYYYMLYSTRDCCSDRSDYEVYVARAEKITGPYEKYQNNPILKGDGRDVQSCGHGTMTETPDGRMFYICHSFMKGTDFYLGRQPMMQEIVLTDDGWIRFKTGQTTKTKQKTPFGTSVKLQNVFYDDFSSAVLNPGWTGSIQSRRQRPMTSGGSLLLPSAAQGAGEYSSALSRRPSSADYNYETHMACGGNSLRGLAYISNAANMVVFGTERGKLVIRQVKDGHASDLFAGQYDGDDIWLGISVDDVKTLRFFYSSDGKKWQSVDDLVTNVFASVRKSYYKPGIINVGHGDSNATFYEFKMTDK